MVGTPSRGRMVIPPIARTSWQAHTPQAEQETAQLLVFPPDEVDWAAVEHNGQQVRESMRRLLHATFIFTTFKITGP